MKGQQSPNWLLCLLLVSCFASTQEASPTLVNVPDAVDPNEPTDGYQIHDSYYDHTDAGRDLNCIFPIDRLRELADAGEIGAVAARHWSGFMGRTYDRSRLTAESAPAFFENLKEDGIDLLIAVPA